MTRARLGLVLAAAASFACGAILAVAEVDSGEAGTVSNPYPGLRAQLLKASRDALGIPQPSSLTEPWGVLMETGYETSSVTVVALADGNSSIYLSSGGGFIGGQGHASVRKAAIAMVREAAKHVQAMARTKSFPLPANGRTVFYVLTDSGVFTGAAAERALGERRHDLAPLFHAGQDVITQYRLINEGK